MIKKFNKFFEAAQHGHHKFIDDLLASDNYKKLISLGGKNTSTARQFGNGTIELEIHYSNLEYDVFSVYNNGYVRRMGSDRLMVLKKFDNFTPTLENYKKSFDFLLEYITKKINNINKLESINNHLKNCSYYKLFIEEGHKFILKQEVIKILIAKRIHITEIDICSNGDIILYKKHVDVVKEKISKIKNYDINKLNDALELVYSHINPKKIKSFRDLYD
jgi:hypothetical protein